MLSPPRSCFNLAALDNMEGESRHEKLIQLNSLDFGGSSDDVSCLTKQDQGHDCLMAIGRTENQINVASLSQWIPCQPASHNYIKFHTGNSIFLREASGKDILDGIPSPYGSIHVVNGISEFQTEILYNNSREASCSKSATSILDLNVQKLGHLNPHIEGELIKELTSAHHQTFSQNHTSREQKSTNEGRNVPQSHLRVTAGKPGFCSRGHDSAKRQRALATDRRRRQLIKERLKAVHELLPHSQECGEATIWDDINDYVKYLQHQVKELTRSRLGGESAADPFIFLEGYGHYLLHGHTMKEPLEEMIGKLLEVNPSVTTELLESRGLVVMPISTAEGLDQAIQMIN